MSSFLKTILPFIINKIIDLYIKILSSHVFRQRYREGNSSKRPKLMITKRILFAKSSFDAFQNIVVTITTWWISNFSQIKATKTGRFNSIIRGVLLIYTLWLQNSIFTKHLCWRLSEMFVCIIGNFQYFCEYNIIIRWNAIPILL